MKTGDLFRKYKLSGLEKFVHKFPHPADHRQFPFVENAVQVFDENVHRVHGTLVNGLFNLQFGVVGGLSSCSSAREACNGRSVDWWDENDPDGLTEPQIRIMHQGFHEHYGKIIRFAQTPKGQEKFGNFSMFLFAKLHSVEEQPVVRGFEASLSKDISAP